LIINRILNRIKNKLTLANRVLPVPGGPYMSKFLNKPLFDFVLRVETAISLKRSSRDGFFFNNKIKNFR